MAGVPVGRGPIERGAAGIVACQQQQKAGDNGGDEDTHDDRARVRSRSRASLSAGMCGGEAKV